MPRGIKYSPEQREELKRKANDLRKAGTPLMEIARTLNIAMGTVNRLLDKKSPKRGRRGRNAAAKASPRAARNAGEIKLSASNPMAQLAVAHERMMDLNKQIAALTEERDKLNAKMDALMKKAAAACPGLKGKK